MIKSLIFLLLVQVPFGIWREAVASRGASTNSNPKSPTSAAVLIKPTDDAQHIIDALPEGTAFYFEPGIYRMKQIHPKSHDSFRGSGKGTILSGAVVLSSFSKTGDLFSAAYKYREGQVHGDCEAKTPFCKYPEDCFIDNKPLRRVGAISEVASGTWFLDPALGVVIISENPTGHIIEVSSARCAFSGTASDVRISDLTVEKYAIPAQMGAIGEQQPGPRWTISRCVVRWNHGTGINVADGSLVTDNRLLTNGQQGIAAHGSNVVISNNEIAYNNFAGFSTRWEAGGTKFSNTERLKVVGNAVHDNVGPGLWTDINNRDTTYESNKVFNNTNEGIKHEISYSAKIENNLVFGNGSGLSVWLWGAQILIQNSSAAEVNNNRVFVPKGYGNGIAVIIQNRGTYVSEMNLVHDNEVTYLDQFGGSSGLACDFKQNAYAVPTNHFNRDHYHVPEFGDFHWAWLEGKKWEDFRQTGNESQGTIDRDVKQPPAINISSNPQL